MKLLGGGWYLVVYKWFNYSFISGLVFVGIFLVYNMIILYFFYIILFGIMLFLIGGIFSFEVWK